MNEKAKDQVDLHIREFQFSQYASHGLWSFPLAFLALAIVDHFLAPATAMKSLGIRSAPLAYFWVSYFVMWKFVTTRRFVSHFVMIGIALAAIITHYFMFTGASPIRTSTPVLIVGVLATAYLFRLSRKQLSWLASLALVPTMAIVLYSTYRANLIGGLVESAFLLATLLIASTTYHDRKSALRIWTKATIVAEEEISKTKRSELLGTQFPLALKLEIESDDFDFKERELSPSAVIGVADFTHVSTNFESPATGLFADWELKEAFNEIASRRAKAAGFIVLSSGSEGLSFVANFRQRGDWQKEMMGFFEGLSGEFSDVVAYLREHVGHFECGVRLGVSMGPTVLGWTRANPSKLEAIGPEIQMATKLCRGSNMNSMTLTASTWNHFRGIMAKWEVQQRSHGEDLRGIEHELPIAEIRSRLVINGSRLTCECNLPLDVVKTKDGLIEVDCAEGHRSDEATINAFRRSA